MTIHGDGDKGPFIAVQEDSATHDRQTDGYPYIVFGYGSLIFRPPPHVIKKSPGFLKGYVRRFAQKSHDHRGTPENPGRVVTLVRQEDWAGFSGADSFPHEDTVWGVAFTIDPAHATEVRAYLDHREKDGYTLERVDVYGLVDGAHETVVIPGAECYVGRNDNPSFSPCCFSSSPSPLVFSLGLNLSVSHTIVRPPAPPPKKKFAAFSIPVGSEPLGVLSETIWHAVGPSGPNKDYVYNLAAAVRALAPEAHDSHLYALEARLRELDRSSASTEDSDA